ncbi:Polysaccharide biosynthesis domain [Arabidopsis thaliana x Arabidopsis arenosa]|uniref:Polysaccharide biosynthesis domain n=1 Tax=Arabidopsis thaliana x Arabidopsis arenosa TaxID=1240361 RepID=A0A8T2C456_9BRAS|nr:Polysaccharide biosynthesis domain [Arabidopsis thaliana x Arabidopsis arenosa]
METFRNYAAQTNANMVQMHSKVHMAVSYAPDIDQLQNEPLRSYIEKFKTTKSKIANLNEEVALAALRNGLWFSSRFREELTVRQPATLDDALHKALYFARAEEETAYLALKLEALGRMSAIYTAGLLARNREDGETDVFVHDVNRPVEDEFSATFLCKGYMREKNERLRHFTISSHRARAGRPFCPVEVDRRR